MVTKSTTKTMGKAPAKVEPAAVKTEATAVKAESKKAAPTKEVAAKAAPAKAAPAKAAPTKATPAKAAPAKKTPAKKPAVKKEIKVKTFVEFYGKQVESSAMLAAVKKDWTKSGRKVGDIKTVELYIKPEEDTVYYMINGTEGGGVPF